MRVPLPGWESTFTCPPIIAARSCDVLRDLVRRGQHPRRRSLIRILSGAPAANPAVAALLDHLATELAREYVRLMEHTAHEAQLAPTPSRQET